MPWSERVQLTLAWQDNAGKHLTDLPANAEVLPYREWLLRPAYEAANRRRNEPGTRQDPPMAGARTREAQRNNGRLPGHEDRGMEGF